MNSNGITTIGRDCVKTSEARKSCSGNFFGWKYQRHGEGNDELGWWNAQKNNSRHAVLLFGKMLAILPVQGLKSKNVTSLSFKWCSIATLCNILFLCIQCFYLYVALDILSTKHFPFLELDSVAFYSSILFTSICFLNLARKWPHIMKRWRDVEVHLPKHQSQLKCAALAHKYKIFLMVFITCSMLEHATSMIVSIHVANYCHPNDEVIESFFKIYLYHLFSVTKYSKTKAFIGKIVNVIETLVWSYNDLFVVAVSEGITAQFRLVNENLFRVKGKVVPEKLWRDYRIHYRSISDLCEEVDAAISGITMISFFNNLYFICMQLLKSINPKPSFAHNVYFWCSMLFLFSRIMTVSLYASAINEESKKALLVLRRIPKKGWCLEAQRFYQEVSSDTVALTGMRFFHLTRTLLCSVAGVIITYEIVLLQWNVHTGIVDECQDN